MKWIMVIIVITFLLSTFLMYGGRSTSRTPGSVNPDGSIADYEVAQINGQPLMRSALERMRVNYLENSGYRNTASIDMGAVYRDILSQVILESQMTQEINARGITISDAEADIAMKAQADRYYVTREAFYQALQQRGIKVEDYKKSLAHQMAEEVLVREAVGDIDISEDQAVEFYNTIKDTFLKQPERYDIKFADFHEFDGAENFRIAVEDTGSWDIAAKDADSADIINITNEPVALSTIALNSGSLNFLASYDLGQVSRVIEVASNDYMVAIKISHYDESVMPYSDVSPDIRNLMTQQEADKRVREFRASLISKAQVVINDNALFQSAAPEVRSDDVNENISDLLIDEVEPEIDGEYEPEDEAEEENTNAEEAGEAEEKAAPVEESKPEEQVSETEKEVADKTAEVVEQAEEIKTPVENATTEVEQEIENKAAEVVEEAQEIAKPVENAASDVVEQVEEVKTTVENAATEVESKTTEIVEQAQELAAPVENKTE